PPIVVSRLDDVDLVAAVWTVLGFPQLAGDRIPGEALRIAMAVAPDAGHGTGAIDERVVLRHRPVVIDAVNLARGFREILRVEHLLLLTDRKEQVVVPVEDEA